MQNIPESVRAFLKILEAHPRVEEIILFGSRAIGDHRERSDVDLAIRGSLLSPEDWTVLKGEASNAESLYWISLVDFDRSPSPIQSRIRTLGKTIYGKKAS
jgi:predicted nucleotidyltransferase